MGTSARIDTKVESFRHVFEKMTLPLFTCWMITALVNIVFGYETTSFAGVQSIPAFAKEFGNTVAPGEWSLSPARASYTSSTAFAGKLLGSLSAPFLVERWGHRIGIWVAMSVALVGVILESTASVSSSIAHFIVGRIVVYFSVGIAEVTSTGYQSEIVPASMRGTVVGSIQLFNLLGQIFAAGVNRGYSTTVAQKGWIIPVAIQAIIPIVVIAGVFIVPDSPRWLISKGRKNDALKVLDRVRPTEDVKAGLTRLEVDALDDFQHNHKKVSWFELVQGTNLRRTLIASGLLGLQQLLGQGFVSQYSPRFYDTVGLSEHAFDYNVGSAALGWGGCLLGILLSDFIGRRLLLIWGGLGQTVFLFLIAGLGIKSNPTAADGRGVVAGVMLFFFIYSGTWGPLLFTVAAELGKGSLREKTLSLGVALNVVTAFIVSFCVPYILNDIGANIGWVFGGIAFCSSILVFLVLPETKDRSLEELDELFEARVPTRKFRTTTTHGSGKWITTLETEEARKVEGIRALYNEK